ncbi:biotin transporter BioY [Xylanibacillus composti]|uniref:Biotin transporter n=1 Tax=Xylanibacillus composti TaxID=1572762 RepID=A0A8J4H0B9_9BACL|nr:biotin transporter BioY [Xylanibacillus composti]MDT9726807.1 biotin transporter BioY [Xylanibacillus composti]GIQ67210.1 biotin transporter BioY [Xylanibacillus composti]
MFKLTVRGVAFSALFAALVVVFGFVSIPLGFTPVPITLQTLAVMLAGGLLGAAYGFFSMFMVVVLTAVGFPLLHGEGGISVLLGPTGGYVWMWPIAALLIGWLAQRLRTNSVISVISIFLAMEVFGSLLLYVTGVPWLGYVANLSLAEAMVAGCYPYLLGDAIKAVAATVITVSVRRLYPIQRLTGIDFSTPARSRSLN